MVSFFNLLIVGKTRVLLIRYISFAKDWVNEMRLRVTLSALFYFIASSFLLASPEWSAKELLYTQNNLNLLGYDAGIPDGLWGRKTKTALEKFYKNEDLNPLPFAFFKARIEKINEAKYDHLDEIIDKKSAVRLENRIGIGAPEHRVIRYVGKTRREAIQIIVKELIEHEDTYKQPMWVSDLAPLGVKDDIMSLILPRDECNEEWYGKSIKQNWINAALKGAVPQFSRLSLFWLDHFSVQFSQYLEPHAYAQHVDFARNWRLDSFPALLKQSLVDPSNIVFLNNDRNHKGNQNENLAREFLELYALGEGNYSEQDIRNLAKLLTGRNYNKNIEAYWYTPKLEYKGTVNIFGHRINNLDEFFSRLQSHEKFGELIVNKFINEFISHEPPSEDLVKRLQLGFINSKFNLIKLFEEVISTKEFWDKENTLSLVKTPYELLVGTARTLNSSGSAPYDRRFLDRMATAIAKMDQNLIDPPNVAGWKSGLEWLQGNQLTLRADLLYKIFSKDILNPKGISLSASRSAWKRYQKHLNYDQNLKSFYHTSNSDELRFETMIFDFFPRNGFKSDQWSRMTFVLVGTQFPGLPLMDVSFNITKEPNGDNFIEFLEQNSHPDLFFPKRYTGNTSEQQFRMRLPLRSSDTYKKLSINEQRRIKQILNASQFILDKRNTSDALKLTNFEAGPALKWFLNLQNLQSIQQYNDSPLTKIKMYSAIDPWNNMEKSRHSKYKKMLCKIHKYESLELVNDYFGTVSDTDSRRSKIFIHNQRTANSTFSLRELLLPDIDVKVGDEDFAKILVSEGYNLK